jgi:hypothetical protein
MRILPRKIAVLFRKYRDAAERGKVHEEISQDEKDLLEKFDLISRDLQPGNGHPIRRSDGHPIRHWGGHDEKRK